MIRQCSKIRFLVTEAKWNALGPEDHAIVKISTQEPDYAVLLNLMAKFLIDEQGNSIEEEAARQLLRQIKVSRLAQVARDFATAVERRGMNN